MSHQRACLAALFTLTGLSLASAQSTQEWTAPLNGNQSGFLQWTQPGPLAADAQGRILAAATVSEQFPFPPTSAIVAELVTLLDSNGQAQWSKRLTTSRAIADVLASPTGGFLVFSSDSAANGLKLSWYHPDGIQTWTQTIPGSGGPQPHGFAVDAQGTAYLCGYDFIGGVVVAAIDSAGAVQWTQNISYGAGTTSEAAGLELSGNGALYMRADVSSPPPIITRSMRVTKLSTSGAVQWTQTAPGASTTGVSMHNNYEAIHADANGVVIGGEVETAGPTHSGFLARYDSAGTFQWSRTIVGTFTAECVVQRIAAASDGTLWTVSFCSVNTNPAAAAVVSRLNPQGALLSNVSYLPPLAYFSYGVGLIVGNAGQAWVPSIVYEQPLPNVVEVRSYLAMFDSSGTLAADQVFDPTATVNDETLFSACEAPGHRLVLSSGEGQSYGDEAFATQLALGDSPQGYCTAKLNSQGCLPALSFTGISSAAESQGFTVHVSNVRDHKPGMYLYSIAGAAAAPFQNGTLCLQAPIKRTPQITAGGTTGCSGEYAIDFNSFAHGLLGGNPSPALLNAGTAVYCQAWGRDPGFAAPNNTTLSSALRYVVLP